MDSSDRLRLPFIISGQAQKEISHNEALQMLDALVAAAVEEPPSDLTPSNPAVGQCWIVGEQPAGEWLGNENCLAAYTSGGWRYLQPFDGLTAFVRSSLFNATYRNGSWEMGIVRADRIEIEGLQVLGQRCDAIADPAGGNVIDVESRTAIASILEALRSHGLIGA